MPTLRLFASAREAAGTARAEIEADTVAELLDKARRQYGDRFGRVLDTSRVWLNGQPAELGAAISGHDVVAVLPPVSGGSSPAVAGPMVAGPYVAARPASPPRAPRATGGRAPAGAAATARPLETPEPSEAPEAREASRTAPDAAAVPVGADGAGASAGADRGGGEGRGGLGGGGRGSKLRPPRRLRLVPPPPPEDGYIADGGPQLHPGPPATEPTGRLALATAAPLPPVGPGPGPVPGATPDADSWPAPAPYPGPDAWPPPGSSPGLDAWPPPAPTAYPAAPSPGPDAWPPPAPTAYPAAPSPGPDAWPPPAPPAYPVGAPGPLPPRLHPPVAPGPLSPSSSPTAVPTAGPGGPQVAAATAAVAEVVPAPAVEPKPVAPLAVVHQSTRPHGRLGVAWALVTGGLLVAGPGWLALWLAALAFVAASQTASVWRKRGERPLPGFAAGAAAALPLTASTGLDHMNMVVAGAIVLTLVARVAAPTKAPGRDVALTLVIGLSVGMAAAAPVLLRSINIPAALYLLACAALYDAGAYLVGTGASTEWEGPAAGVAALIPVTLVAALALVPPFDGGAPLLLGVLAAVLAPFGPVAGSALLGDRTAYAPGLRRLDSLLVMGPIWAWCAAALLT